MSLSDTWKAPLDLLQQDLWTLEQGLFVCAGYFKTKEFFTYDILVREYTGDSRKFTEKLKDEVVEKGKQHETWGMRDIDVYYSIATGKKTDQSIQKYFDKKIDTAKVQAAEEAIGNIIASVDVLQRVWLNTAHDTDERKIASDDGAFMNEKWTKTYIIKWALRHGIVLTWLNDVIKEGYVSDLARRTENGIDGEAKA